MPNDERSSATGRPSGRSVADVSPVVTDDRTAQVGLADLTATAESAPDSRPAVELRSDQDDTAGPTPPADREDGDRQAGDAPEGDPQDGADPQAQDEALAALLEYLEAAPEAVSSLARQHADLLRTQGAGVASGAPVEASAAEQSAADEATAEPTPDLPIELTPEDVDALVAEDDDDLGRREPARSPRVKRAAGNAAEATPDVAGAAQIPVTAVSPRSRTGLWFVLILVIVATISALAAVWYVGRDTPDPGSSSSQAAEGEPMTEAQAAARIAELKVQLDKEPENTDARSELALLHFEAGDIKAAKEQWIKVTEIDPKRVDAWFNLGFAYYSSTPSDPESAKAAWQKVVDLDPDSQVAQTAKTHIQGMLSKAGGASPATTTSPDATPSGAASAGPSGTGK